MTRIYYDIDMTLEEVKYIPTIVKKLVDALVERENLFRRLENIGVLSDEYDIKQTETRYKFIKDRIRRFEYEVNAYVSANQRLIEKYKNPKNIEGNRDG